MKICILTGFFFPEINGVSISIFHRCKYLAKENEITLMIPDYKSNHSTYQELKDLGIKIKLLPSTKSEVTKTETQLSIYSVKLIKYTIKQQNPDLFIVDDPIVLYHQIGFELGHIEKNENLNTIAYCHGDFSTFLWKWKKYWTSFKIKRKLIGIYNSYDFTLFSSEYMLEKFSGISNGKLLPFLAVDKDFFSNKRRNKKSIIKILYAGRLTIDKNVDLIVNCAEIINKERDNYEWHFAGDGPLLKKYSDLDSDKFIFHGFKIKEDLLKLYHQSDIYVNACDYESFGLSIIEAMSTGLPVVVPDKGGSSNHFVNYHSGLTFKSKSKKSFINKIYELSDDKELANYIGDNSRMMVNSWQEVIEHQQKFFNNLHTSVLEKDINNKTELISVLTNEYTKILDEVSQYTKHIIQLKSFFLAFFATAIGLLLNDLIMVAPIIQVLIFPFIFIIIQLDQNVIVNSNYLIYLEKRLNIIFNNDIAGWQRCAAYYNIDSFKQKRSILNHVGPLMFTLTYFIIYIISVIYTFDLLKEQNYYISYIYFIGSILVYVGFYWLLNLGRKSHSNKSIDFLNKQFFRFNRGLIKNKKRTPNNV